MKTYMHDVLEELPVSEKKEHTPEMLYCSSEETEYTPRRLVACVNACAGIPTQILENSSNLLNGAKYVESLKDSLVRINQECDALKAQRDELLDAVANAIEAITADPLSATLEACERRSAGLERLRASYANATKGS